MNIRFQPPEIVVGVLVEADVLAQPLGIEPPTLGIGGVADVFAKLRQPVHLLRDRDLQVVAGNTLMVGVVSTPGSNRDSNLYVEMKTHSRPLSVRSSCFVIGKGRVLLQKRGNRLHR